MTGWLTNGAPQVGPAIVNGVTLAVPQGIYPEIASHALVSTDTQAGAGAPPQTVAVSNAQIAFIAAALIHNAATSTVHAATLNTLSGTIVTEALTTAVGATYVFTLTNSLIAANTPLLFDIRSGSNTVVGMTPTSLVTAAGVATLTFTNLGPAALNGTMVISFHI